MCFPKDIQTGACVLVFSVIVILTVQGGSVAGSLSKSEIQATGKVLFRALRDSECKIKCVSGKSGKSRPVCGTDGITYLSKCELKRAKRCEGKNVDVKKKGKCSAKDVPMTKCFQEKEEALELSKGDTASEDIFIPECRDDGMFAEIQCHRASGYCWCVNDEGRPHPGTSTKNSKPNCKAKTKAKKSSRPKRKKGKECNNSKRNEFNTNILRVFTEEYNREMGTRTTPTPSRIVSDQVMDSLEKQVVEWKFSQIDKDRDDTLKRKEVKTLRKLVKKYIKPRPCAKQFLKYCDSDNNRLIERSEWSRCLGVNINISFRLFVLMNSDGEETEGTEENVAVSTAEDRQLFTPHALPDSRETPNRSPNRISSTPVIRQDNNPKDCLSEQAAAVIQDKENPGGGIFVPNCANGKWARAQCHNSTGYCWCVDENNGRPIVGTSTHMVLPKCDFESEREMKGCAYARKQSFISGLLNKLTEEMGEYTSSNNYTERGPGGLTPDPPKTVHEKAVSWKFSSMDTNSNEILEREEYDAFKKTLRRNREKYTRKCSRNFIRYCDEDGDKKIALNEWVSCMGISDKGHFNGNLPTNPKRTGKNPFDEFLKDT